MSDDCSIFNMATSHLRETVGVWRSEVEGQIHIQTPVHYHTLYTDHVFIIQFSVIARVCVCVGAGGGGGGGLVQVSLGPKTFEPLSVLLSCSSH